MGIWRGVGLMCKAANLNLVAFSRFGTGGLQGHVFAIFVIIIAACEVAVALAIILSIYQRYHDVNLDKVSALKG